MLAIPIRRALVSLSALLLVTVGGISGAPAASAADVEFAPSTAGQSPGPLEVTGFPPTDVLLVGISLDGAPAGTTFSLPVTTGLTASYGYSFTGAMTEMTFTGTTAATNSALAAMLVSTGSATGAFTINITASPNQANLYYFPELNHYYKYVASTNIPWSSAKAGAAASTLFGVTGYLVTITTAAENDFVANYTTAANIWIGASDDTSEGASEGVWKWVTGPEAGTQFWSGQRAAFGGYATAPFYYAAWNFAEPNNSGSNEHYAVTNWLGSVGEWNDIEGNWSNVSFPVNGYLIEYSGTFTGVTSIVRTAQVGSAGGSTEPAVPMYTLTYDANGGTCSASPQTGPATSWVVSPGSTSCSRSGYSFTGWNTSANGLGLGFAPGASLQLNGDNTLYAQWTIATPTAVDDTASTSKDTLVSGSLVTNDTAPPGSTYSLLTRARNGRAVVSADGSYSYSPNPGFTGVDSFTYQLCTSSGSGGVGSDGGPTGGNGGPTGSGGTGGVGGDGDPFGSGGAGGRRSAEAEPPIGTYRAANCSTATVTITVTGPEPATRPAVVTPPGEQQSGSVAEPGTLPEGTVYSIVKEPQHGTVVMEPNGSYTYTPNPGFSGTDSFTYEVCIPGATACPQFVVPIRVGKASPSGDRCGENGARITVGFTPLSSNLNPSARRALDRLRPRDCRVVVTGYVQPVGTTSNDRSLSKARAQAVEAYVRKRNPEASFVVIAGDRTIEPSCSRSDNRCVVVSLRQG
jgi:uncharacterized repeat protein (TIGR02543 family)